MVRMGGWRERGGGEGRRGGGFINDERCLQRNFTTDLSVSRVYCACDRANGCFSQHVLMHTCALTFKILTTDVVHVSSFQARRGFMGF